MKRKENGKVCFAMIQSRASIIKKVEEKSHASLSKAFLNSTSIDNKTTANMDQKAGSDQR